MATRTVVCPECSEPLTLGRLSCSNCGSLLASVAGAPRRTRPLRTVVVDEPAWLSDDDSLGWTVDEGSGHDADEDHESRSWQAAVAPQRPDLDTRLTEHGGDAAGAVPPIVVDPDDARPSSVDDGADAVLAEPEAAPPAAEAAVELPAAATEPVPDSEAGAGVGLGPAADDELDPQTQLSWVDLRVAAVTGPDAAAGSDGSPGEDLGDAETPGMAEAAEPPVDAAEPPEPRPEESPVEPDVPATESTAAGTDEPPERPDAPIDEPEVADEPIGAPGDVDDASEPPPPDVVPAGSSADSWVDARDEEPARPLQPSHSTRSHIDLTARPATRASAPTAWEPTEALSHDDSLPGGAPTEAPTRAETLDGRPAWAPAGAWEPPEPADADEAVPPAGAWVPPTTDLPSGPAAVAHPAPTAAARRSDLRLDAPDDLPTGLTVVGSGIGTLGFLLPWAAAGPASVGWTERWGLADPSYLLVFLASAALLGLNVVPNGVPAWIRAGALPLGLGSLLLGLVWPAMLGGSGMQLGAVAVTFAAFLLVAGGAVGVARARHEGSQTTV